MQSAVLDTNVASGLVTGDIVHLAPEFLRLARTHVRLHLSVYSVDELVPWLNALPVEVAVRAANFWASTLDPDIPILPHGELLYALGGFGSRPAKEATAGCQLLGDLWRRNVESLRNHGRMADSDLADGVRLAVQQETQKWAQGHDALRDANWTAVLRENGFESCTKNPAGYIEECLPRYRKLLDDACPAADVSASTRRDGWLRVRALRNVRQAFGKEPADLAKGKYSGEAYDQSLLDTLSLPAFFVTSERGIHNDLSAAGSYQKAWVFTPSGFVDAARCGLPALRFPTGRPSVT